MNCPKCQYSNPSGTEICYLCHEVLLHNAGKAFFQTVRRVHSTPSDSKSAPARAPKSISGPLKNANAKGRPGPDGWVANLPSWFSRNHYAFFIGSGLAIMALGVGYYLSPMTRMGRYGTNLIYRFEFQKPAAYFVGSQMQSRIFALRDGVIDTPLPGQADSEAGSLIIDRQSDIDSHAVLRVRSQEWMRTLKTPDGDEHQMIPKGHPSTAPAQIFLDAQGTLVSRQNASSLRLGRAVTSLFPRFPKGIQRVGSRWTEPIEWTLAIGDWRIAWEGELSWLLKDYEPCYKEECAKLTYEAHVLPRILQPPQWAKGNVTDASFQGKAGGEVLYNVKKGIVISAAFAQNGNLTVGINHLDSIPSESRVGVPLSGGPGAIVMQMTNRFDVRKP